MQSKIPTFEGLCIPACLGKFCLVMQVSRVKVDTSVSDYIVPCSRLQSLKICLDKLALLMQVLSRPLSDDASREAALADIFSTISFPDNQRLQCYQAQQQMALGRVQGALTTAQRFMRGALLPSTWALHMAVHAHWLNGDADQVSINCNAQWFSSVLIALFAVHALRLP